MMREFSDAVSQTIFTGGVGFPIQPRGMDLRLTLWCQAGGVSVFSRCTWITWDLWLQGN